MTSVTYIHTLNNNFFYCILESPIISCSNEKLNVVITNTYVFGHCTSGVGKYAGEQNSASLKYEFEPSKNLVNIGVTIGREIHKSHKQFLEGCK